MTNNCINYAYNTPKICPLSSALRPLSSVTCSQKEIDLFVDGRNIQAEQNGQIIEYPELHFETANPVYFMQEWNLWTKWQNSLDKHLIMPSYS